MKKVSSSISWLALAALAGLFVLPFLWMLSTALKADRQIFALPMRWLPRARLQGSRDCIELICDQSARP